MTPFYSLLGVSISVVGIGEIYLFSIFLLPFGSFMSQELFELAEKYEIEAFYSLLGVSYYRNNLKTPGFSKSFAFYSLLGVSVVDSFC